MKLANYLNGAWVEGKGKGQALTDPVTGIELARADSSGLDLGAALNFARKVGGGNLKRLSFKERAALLKKIAEALTAKREEYFKIALENSGNTKADARIDVDGAIGTLRYYAALGDKLGESRCLIEPGFDRLAKDENFQSAHLWTPIPGAAIHINAFNFPAWGLWEKAAVALLSGVPVLAKPATQTALLSQRMVADVAAILPEGALSLLVGGGRDLLDHVEGGDAISFTGSADTASQLKSNPRVIAANARFTVEADSLNAAILGPDARADAPIFDLFCAEVAKEMREKAGQKCTAIRRALVPAGLLPQAAEAIAQRLAKEILGDPRNPAVTIGPLVSKAQQKAGEEGLARLLAETRRVTPDAAPLDADPAKACFLAPALLLAADPGNSRAVHDVEVFGPVATLIPYRDRAEAFALAARGGGSLAASVFSEDADFALAAAAEIGPWHGRILLVDSSVGAAQTGHGIVMPQCVHGGPGRAGAGEELGGLRGLRFYHQRSAVQGAKARLEKLAAGAAAASL